MLITNTAYMIETDHWYFGITSKVIECLPNGNYRIDIECFDPFDQCLPHFKELDEEGYRKYNIGLDDIVDTEFHIIADTEIAELIKTHPAASYFWYHMDWIKTKYTIFKDHFTVDATPLTSFKEYINFLVSTNDRPYLVTYVKHDPTKCSPTICASPDEYHLIYKDDDKLIVECLKFGISDIDQIRDLHYDEIPESYTMRYKRLFEDYADSELSRVTIHTLNGEEYDIPKEV